LNGRYGPYITDKQRNAKIPKDKEPKSLTLEECQALLAAAPVRTFGKWGRKGAKSKNTKAPSRDAAPVAAPKRAAAARKPAAADGTPLKLAAKASKGPANKKAPVPVSDAAAVKPKARPKAKKAPAKQKV
jgi:DNA topoisomerase-1